MDDTNLSLNKRRHKPHSITDYHPRYKKHANMGRDKWRTDYRDSSKYIDRPERTHMSNQYKESQDTMWDVETNLIGQKEPNPMIHLCDTCKLPIRSYGRLIPCKHVFCFKCAKKTDKNCPRCGDEVHRIEQCRHGTVWMCEVVNCSRTYLSQRDLHAHVNHRHSKPPPPPNISTLNTGPPPQVPGTLLVPPMPPSTIPQLQNPPAIAPYVMVPPISANQVIPPISIPPHDSNGIQNSQDMITRPSSNLITIQIQDIQQNQPMTFDQSASQSQQPPPMYSGPPPTCYSKSIPHNSQPRMSNDQWM